MTSTTYNSTYYVVFLVLLTGIAILGQLRARPRWLKISLGIAALCMCFGVAFPETWAVQGYQLVFVPFLAAIILTYAAFRPSTVAGTAANIDPIAPRLALVWFAVPFMIYDFFLVKRPGTHFWTMYPGLILMSAFGLDTVKRWLRNLGIRRPVWVITGAILAVILIAVFAYYLCLVFIRVYPEYRAAYPDTKSPIYWTAYEDLPERDYFGFSHRAGWKAVGALYAQGVLKGEYDSNEGGEITAWYLESAPRYYCNPAPKYYFWAESAQDPGKEIDLELLSNQFSEIGLVTVSGHPGIHINERNAHPEKVIEYAVESYERDFDLERNPRDQWTVMGQFVSTPYAANFADTVDLVGYDLDSNQSCPTGQLMLTLYWRRHGPPIQESYKIFVHLESDRLWAQADDVPGCSAWPTTNWKAGEIIADRHIIALPDDIPPDEYALSIGVYEPNRGTRLDVVDDSGKLQGNSLHLTDVSVRPCVVQTDSVQ